ncbi:hypothetical protein [Duganella levis]|uniref:Uncharacterized protein n=1 Tax=Duganella levis TaxID=2692169 RepID=A0ABW9W6M6_9BURK|nr:hypothetical protein [Duganella levis]MYN29352.1 hypothetical protein [Duganella levis]
MNILRLSSLIFPLLVSSLCRAEVPTYDLHQTQRDGVVLVGMECHHRNLTWEIGLFFPANPPTKRMDLWNIADLVKFNPTTYNLEKVETVERRCNVGGNHYKIQFEGIPGASNAMWMCGASNGVHASVWRNDKLVFDEDLNKCSRDDYIQQVRFKDGVDAPEVDRHS